MGFVRMILFGYELIIDYDEKVFYEFGFKDMQMVFVFLGVLRREWKGEGVQLLVFCFLFFQKDNILMFLFL